MHSRPFHSFGSQLATSGTMDIPDQVEGFIDLETLGKIKSTLSDSADQDDTDLAAWIQKNYLYQPIDKTEDGRPIRSREGFEKLDRAYKRVRSLTNRAQDKWPFFDRHWKKMPVNTVRQVAQGFPAMHGSAMKAVDDFELQLETPTATMVTGAEAVAFKRLPGTTVSAEIPTAATVHPAKLTPPPSEIQTPSPLTERSKIEMNGKAAASIDQSESQLTAATAESVTTNLDDLPPASSTRKRKRLRNSNGTFGPNEDDVQKKPLGGLGGRGVRGGRGNRAGRGGRGGKGERGGQGGAPSRLSQPSVADSDIGEITLPTFSEPPSSHNATKAPDTVSDATSSSSLSSVSSSISTRRSTRQSTRAPWGQFDAGTTLNPSDGSWEDVDSPVPEALIPSPVQPATMRKADASAASKKARVQKKPTPLDPTEEKLLMLDPVNTEVLATTNTITVDNPKASASIKGTGAQGKPGSGSPSAASAVDTASSIEYIARVQTKSGLLEISVPTSFLADVEKLNGSIQQFLTWKDGRGKETQTTFEEFYSIFGFAQSSKV